MDQETRLGQSVDGSSSWLSLALWRLAAGALYAFALLFIRHNLIGALLLLSAALLCLPGARAAFGRKTGVRIPGLANAALVVTFVLCGLLITGWNADAPRGGDLEIAAQDGARS